MRRLFPPRPFLDALAVRVLLLWMFARAIVLGGSAAMGIAFPASLLGGPAMPLAVFGAVLLVTRIEVGRRAEHVFLANLGCSPTRVAALVAAECAALELALRLGVG